MKRSLSLPRSVMRYWQIAKLKTSVQERLNLLDLFFAAGILRGMGMSGQNYGLLPLFPHAITILMSTLPLNNTYFLSVLKGWSKQAKRILSMVKK